MAVFAAAISVACLLKFYGISREVKIYRDQAWFSIYLYTVPVGPQEWC